MVKWEWNNIKLEIDMDDVDFHEKYEKAFEKAAQKEQELQKKTDTLKMHEFSRQYCDIFYTIFDGIYGEGTAEKLFNGKRNFRILEEAYNSWLSLCKKDIEESLKRRKAMYGKFSVVAKR